MQGSTSASTSSDGARYWPDSAHAVDSYHYPYPAPASSTPTSHHAFVGNGGPDRATELPVKTKKKITRVRPLRSCIACNKRKIKCDRAEPACGQCFKRGEADKCTLALGKNLFVNQNPTSLLDRLRDLETRVEELEATQYGREPSEYMDDEAMEESADAQDSAANTNGNHAPPKPKVDDNPQDATEEAALVLESLCNTGPPPSFHGDSSANSPSVVKSGDENRSQRSTILVDPNGDGSASDYQKQRSAEIRMRILTSPAFPSRQLSDYLIGTYFRLLDVYWHFHISWLWEREYADFWQLHKAERFTEIDPAWLALYYLTLALGSQVAEIPLPAEAAGQAMSYDEISERAHGWVDDAEELLKAADWLRKPQFRTLQTVVLLNGYQTMSTLRDPAGAPWNAAAIRLAQLMGLHELDDDTKMPPDDLAVPTGSNAVKLQVGRRLWASLVVLENVYAVRMGLTLPLASTPYRTILPLNVNDKDLAVQPIKERPLWQLTNTSSLLLRLVLVTSFRELLILPPDMTPVEKYKHVLSIDSRLRKMLMSAPANPLPTDENDLENYKSQNWRLWAHLADVHGQLLEIHRPYMVRGYTDSRFALSVKVCIESAKVICESRQHLQDSVVDERFWWSCQRWLSVAIVIYIDIFHAIDSGCPEDILAMKKAEIPGLQAILKARTQSCFEPVRNIAYAASSVIENLAKAEQMKKDAALHRRNSVTTGPQEAVEPVGSVLQRIAKDMAQSEHLPAKAGRKSSGIVFGRSRLEGASQGIAASPSKQALSDLASSGSQALHTSSWPGQGQQRTNRAAVLVKSESPQLRHPPYADFVMTEPRFGITQDGPDAYSQHGLSHLPIDAARQQRMVANHTPTVPASIQAPITWDTSHFFHPDPSVLLQSMGYSSTGPPTPVTMPRNGMYSHQHHDGPAWASEYDASYQSQRQPPNVDWQWQREEQEEQHRQAYAHLSG